VALEELEQELSGSGSDKAYEELITDAATARAKLSVMSQEMARAEEALEQELARQQSPEVKAAEKELERLKKAADKQAQAVEKLYEDFEKERVAKRDLRPRSQSKGGAKEKTQQPPKSSGPQEEVKQSTPKRLDEVQLQDGNSAEAPTSAKSQSTPEKAEASASIAGTLSGEVSSGKELKKDKWWLRGVSGQELGHLEGVDDDEEPLIFM
jgi:hypothetical protein